MWMCLFKLYWPILSFCVVLFRYFMFLNIVNIVTLSNCGNNYFTWSTHLIIDDNVSQSSVLKNKNNFVMWQSVQYCIPLIFLFRSTSFFWSPCTMIWMCKCLIELKDFKKYWLLFKSWKLTEYWIPLKNT